MFKISSLLFLWVFAIVAHAQETISDPTKPIGFNNAAVAGSANAQQAIRLTSILIATDRKVAIINGQPLQENQTLKSVGALVKKIDADAVTLQQNGKVWRVALNNTAIRK